MTQTTPFIGEYGLRFNYSRLKALARSFKLKSVIEFGDFVVGGKLDEEGIIKTLTIGLQAQHPEITEDDLTKEGGLFDQYMEDHGYGDIVSLVIQSLIDCGVLAKASPNQVAGEGGNQTPAPNPKQLTNG